MKALIITDLHLTDSPKDKYRFDIFKQAKKKLVELEADWLFILGDITDKKDNHSAWLTNLITSGLTMLAQVRPVLILMGNHDYFADPTTPFFKFVNAIEGVAMCTEHKLVKFEDGTELFFVPHIREKSDWDKVEVPNGRKPAYAFIHQPVTGAISESGQRLDGYSLRPIKSWGCPVIAGDIHHPHKVGPVTYVGPPYHIRFGDDYEPRGLFLDTATKKQKSIYFDFPKKHSLAVTSVEELANNSKLRPNDIVKLEITLSREEAVEREVLKKDYEKKLADMQLVNGGIKFKVAIVEKRKKAIEKTATRSPKEVLDRFCVKEQVPALVKEVGLKILAM